MNDRIGADRHVRPDERRGRVDQRDARFHERHIASVFQNCAHVCQLSAAVDPEDLTRVLRDHRFDDLSARAVDRHEVGQVVLPLGVRGPDALQCVEQTLEIECVDPAVDLGDRPLLRGGVLVLDDRVDGAVRLAVPRATPDDPAVAMRILDDGREHRCGSARLPVPLNQGLECGWPQQWNVAGQQHHRAPFTGQHGLGLQQRMAGPKLRVLHCKAQAQPFREGLLDRFRLMANDDGR
jgi:hypothetical protein